ncbi:MAG TPA: hypothetical protein VMD29_11950 [Terracidiphilus sp.]|nr:hypothetical protein [Terracidiphilus sp.]
MSKLIAVAGALSTSQDSRISFTTEGGGSWPAWDRFITLDGKKAYHIGNVCGSCGFFFERMDGANDKVSVAELTKRFETGVTQLDPDLLRTVEAALPVGEYRALLAKCLPKRVLPSTPGDYFGEDQLALWGLDGFWGLPHYTKTEYYRTEEFMIPDGGKLFEFVVPMFPKPFLRQDTIDFYKLALSQGATPTALALSVLDVKQPSEWEGKQPEVNAHWCLTHYLLDGHHKTYAASEAGLPISILSFLAVDQGVSSREEIAEVIRVLGQH